MMWLNILHKLLIMGAIHIYILQVGVYIYFNTFVLWTRWSCHTTCVTPSFCRLRSRYRYHDVIQQAIHLCFADDGVVIVIIAPYNIYYTTYIIVMTMSYSKHYVLCCRSGRRGLVLTVPSRCRVWNARPARDLLEK